VVFDLPAGSSPSSTWDSVRSGSGQHLIFDNAAWNGALTPGSSTSFGFVVVGLGRPVSCTVNGGPCDTLPPFAAAPDRKVRSRLALDHRGSVESGDGARRVSAMASMELAPFNANAVPSAQRRALEPAPARQVAGRAGAGGRAGRRRRPILMGRRRSLIRQVGQRSDRRDIGRRLAPSRSI
jgi:hypothetical protein